MGSILARSLMQKNNIDEYSEDEKQIKIKNLENQLVKEKEGLLSPVDIWEKFVKKISATNCVTTGLERELEPEPPF